MVMMSGMSRRVSTGSTTGDCPIPSVIVPNNTYGGNYPRSNHDNVHPMSNNGANNMMMSHQGMGSPMHRHHSQQQHLLHQQKMDNVIMNDYSGSSMHNGAGYDAYDMGQHRGRSMDPLPLGQGGGNMDQLMDFPSSQMYLPPVIRRPSQRGMMPHRTSMNHLHAQNTIQTQVTSYVTGNDIETFAHKVPVHDSEKYRTMVRTTNSSSPSGVKSNVLNGNAKRKSRRPSTTSFPTKLYKILADPRYHDVIMWLPHGRAWRVLKPKALEDDIIPKYFRSDRLASFMRQVNGWGFKRITEGPDLNAYYHEMFLRGLPHICNKMRRPVRGETGLSRDLGQHPDFYKISMFAPLPPATGTSSPSSKQQQQQVAPLPTKDSSNAVASPPSSTIETINFQQKSPGVVSHDEGLLMDGTDATIVDDDIDDNKDVLDTTTGAATTLDNENKIQQRDDCALITSASLDSPPRSPATHTDHSISNTNTPNAYFGNGNGMTMLGRSSSANSLSSWNDHQDNMMWGSGQHSVTASPTSTNMDQWGPISQTDSFINTSNLMVPSVNGFGHITPPGGPNHHNQYRSQGLNGTSALALRFQQRQQEQLRLPFDGISDNMNDGNVGDENGLSAADLCYLTQQNRILLTHSSNGRQQEGAK